MTESVKSGQELLEEFFAGIETINDVDPAIAETVKRLFEEKKLTATSIANALSSLREGGDAREDKEG